jgi:hypothetical protein
MAPDFSRYVARHNADSEIVAAALNGADIRIFLEPDETIKTRSGTERYIEALELPHLIVRDGAMWATQRNLVSEPVSPGIVGETYFAYFTGLDIFASVSYPANTAVMKPTRAQIMSTGRYKRLRWIARGQFEAVYDSENPDRFDALVDAIEAGARFKMRVDFDNGGSQIHPVIYPFYFAKQKQIQIDTEIQYFPTFMRESRDAFLAALGADLDGFSDYQDLVKREKMMTVTASSFCAFYRVFKGARGKRIYDLSNEAVQPFARTIVYAER